MFSDTIIDLFVIYTRGRYLYMGNLEGFSWIWKNHTHSQKKHNGLVTTGHGRYTSYCSIFCVNATFWHLWPTRMWASSVICTYGIIPGVLLPRISANLTTWLLLTQCEGMFAEMSRRSKKPETFARRPLWRQPVTTLRPKNISLRRRL